MSHYACSGSSGRSFSPQARARSEGCTVSRYYIDHRYYPTGNGPTSGMNKMCNETAVKGGSPAFTSPDGSVTSSAGLRDGVAEEWRERSKVKSIGKSFRNRPFNSGIRCCPFTRFNSRNPGIRIPANLVSHYPVINASPKANVPAGELFSAPPPPL